MYPESTDSYRFAADADVAAPSQYEGVGQALHSASAALDSLEEIVMGIENRIHGPRPIATSAGKAGNAHDPGVLRVASDNADRLARLRDRLAKVNATL